MYKIFIFGPETSNFTDQHKKKREILDFFNNIMLQEKTIYAC